MATKNAISTTKWALAALVVSGCGTAPSVKRAEAGNRSKLDYITFGSDVAGLVAHAKQPTIKACLSGVDSTVQEKWTSNIKSVVGKWVGTMTGMTSDRLNSDIQVITNGSNCDVDVSVEAGTWSNTNIGDHPTVHMGDSGYFASYNVLLHEFGHAFALGDTYQDGQSGNCQPGQPQAVMCNTSFDAPQSDDVKGIGEIFKSAFPNDRPGNPQNPPNPPNPPTGPNYSLVAALGQDLGNGAYAMKIGLSGAAEAAGGVMEICSGGKSQCASGGTWAAVRRDGSKGDAVIFAVDSQTVGAGQQLTIRYTFTGGAAQQTIEFRG